MNTERIKEIQSETAYPESISVQQALLKVWNECEQSKNPLETIVRRTKFKEGDRVFSYGFGYEQHNGTIHKNTEYPEVSEWYIKYDDGEKCAVLDENGVYLL